MLPRHFHLGACILMGAAAGGLTAISQPLPATLMGCGAVVALVFWKASKMGIIDR